MRPAAHGLGPERRWARVWRMKRTRSGEALRSSPTSCSSWARVMGWLSPRLSRLKAPTIFTRQASLAHLDHTAGVFLRGHEVEMTELRHRVAKRIVDRPFGEAGRRGCGPRGCGKGALLLRPRTSRTGRRARRAGPVARARRPERSRRCRSPWTWQFLRGCPMRAETLYDPRSRGRPARSPAPLSQTRGPDAFPLPSGADGGRGLRRCVAGAAGISRSPNASR